MIHVRLEELKGLLLNHPHCLRIYQLFELLDLVFCNALPVSGSLEGSLKDALDVRHRLNALPHAETEVTKPFVVESDSPVLTQEFDHVRNDFLIVP